MLCTLGYVLNQSVEIRNNPTADGKYARNEKEDMQKAIEYLYEFKKKLDELHPQCIHLIDNMLQKNTRY